MNTTDIIKQLNDLLEKQMEIEKNYLLGINNIFHKGLRKFFHQQAEKKNEYVQQIALEIQHLGGELTLQNQDTLEENKWLKLEYLLTKDIDFLVDECVKAEEQFIKDYNSVLNNLSLSETTLNMLKTHQSEMSYIVEHQGNLKKTLKEYV
ncbi:DUF2383 domain-containing protein [Zhouia sp. PK063]|uniref:DUF2383 domain-containing protein n=1 Tax=Zhouia sp. PK063 TaxID=3373602 RepID=UPI003798167D